MKESLSSFQRLVNIRFRQWQIKHGETNIGDWKEQNKRKASAAAKKPPKTVAEICRKYREKLTPEQIKERRRKAREYQAARAAALTPEQWAEKRAKAKAYDAARAAKRTPEEQAAHKAKLAEQQRRFYAKKLTKKPQIVS
jgi:hypothetical protein